MGMFDDVVGITVQCPGCDKDLDMFQTKSGPCNLSKINYKTVTNFYTYCDRCGTWVEYNRALPPAKSIEDFTLTFEIGKVEIRT
jgi:hypothetical protein